MLRWKIARIVSITTLLGILVSGCGSTRKEWPYSVEINGVRLNLEVAVTPAETSRGLMYRDALDRDWGMIFAYASDQSMAFWMENTTVPLSIAFVDGALRIVDIQDMQPLAKAYHFSKAPYRYAIEVNQGWYRDRGIAVGATVKFSSGLEEYLRRHPFLHPAAGE